MNKKIIITSIVLLVGFLAYPKTKSKTMIAKKLKYLVPNQTIRGCDGKGCGTFGADRGNRKHQGIDILTFKGQQIVSPISGVVTRKSYPYANDLNFEGLLIENGVYSVYIWYITPWKVKDQQVTAGDVIGVSQNIAEKYGSTMQTHVHITVKKNGVTIDPTNLF